MVDVITGAVAGLVATIVMTAFMMTIGDDSPPPTASLWSQYVGDAGPDAYMMQGMILHFLYGIGAGAVFTAGGDVLNLSFGADEMALTLVAAVVYGLVLMVVGAVFWMKIVLAMDPDRQTAMQFGLFHLVYGIVLGVSVVYLPL